ncbi:hypothetical protein DXG01_001242 [Tephrocybe rancida]|nr:hypothetical protein DXG01_001242 [Tephrocybe rancida]
MLAILASSAWLLALTQGARSFPVESRAATSPVSVSLNGDTYINKVWQGSLSSEPCIDSHQGLVAFGLIPANARDSTGDSLGGIGSGIDIKSGTWAKTAFGTFTGTLVVTPDRGFNVEGTVDYQARQHEIDFVLSPYYGTSKLSFANAQKTLALTYKNTVLRSERNNVKTSGLDPTAVRDAQSGFPDTATADPELPIASTSEPHLTLDVEGLVFNPDGSSWISDEYGPYIYKYSATGQLIQTIQPPKAILPLDQNGDPFFTSTDDPKTGRAGNKGFESLTIDRKNNILYSMLQSATIQDGGDDKSTSRYTRLLAYDVSDSSVTPPLVGEWVVPLPLSDKDNTEECNEIQFLSPGIFLALSRDGDGHGGDDDNTKYKNADLFSIVGATDIHGTKFDDPENPIATNGQLNKNIVPATYKSFVEFAEENGLARFGLHNDSPADETLIDAKWESLTLAPVGDSAFPDDFFLFTVADNDFLTTNGVTVGKSYDAGIDVDTQFLVFRVTIPGAAEFHSHGDHKVKQMGSIAYITGDLFSAPKGTILVQACNTVGSWGAGIAVAFRERYPSQFQLYKAHCKQSSPEDLIGTCLLIPGEEHHIACLFTSRAYGKRKDKPEEILAATKTAVLDLIGQNTEGREFHACRFNSGKFGVPWANTEAVLKAVGASMTIYTPSDEP